MHPAPAPARAPQTALWVQLLIGWLPALVLFLVLLAGVHGEPLSAALLPALRLVGSAALLGLLVMRAVRRWPWPHPLRARFVLGQLLAAPLFAAGWIGLNSLLESALRGRLVLVAGPGLLPFFVSGLWFYVMIAGVGYAQQSARRAAELEAAHQRARLAALRTQLHPHFLFNALHTVVQLIALDPPAASRATEQLAGLLRATLDNERDVLPLADEWAMVQQVLAIESLRMGERLRLEHELADEAMGLLLPSFSLQTLVENSLRHAVEPALRPVCLRIRAHAEAQGRRLVLEVSDDGPGTADRAAPQASGVAGSGTGSGTGLQRLRERLAGLFGHEASLDVASQPGQGFRVRLSVPQPPAGDGPSRDGH